MNKTNEISTFKAWLMLLASLLDDAVVLVLIFLGLWYFHVKITWPIIVLVAVLMVVFVFVMHHAVIPSIRRRKVTGAEAMIGAAGIVIKPLNPVGTVKIENEYWQAASVEGDIETGSAVEVVKMTGLRLEVRKIEP